jgi:hypothetical protein
VAVACLEEIAMGFEPQPFGLLGVVFSLLTSSNLKAQLRGVLEGTVGDPQGMTVPAVRVTATKVDMNISVATVTNSAGTTRSPT